MALRGEELFKPEIANKRPVCPGWLGGQKVPNPTRPAKNFGGAHARQRPTTCTKHFFSFFWKKISKM
jgi:hypothetical protein